MLLTMVPLPKAGAAEGNVNPKPSVIPSLQDWKGDVGNYTLSSASRITLPTTYAKKLAATALVFQKDLIDMTGVKYAIVITNAPKAGDIVLTMNGTMDDSIGDEGYYFAVLARPS